MQDDQNHGEIGVRSMTTKSEKPADSRDSMDSGEQAPVAEARMDHAVALRAEVQRLRAALEQIAAQTSGTLGSTSRADCMAAWACAALSAQATQEEPSWATSTGSQPSTLASSHPDAPPVFCHHLGMVCASNCQPDQCFEAPDGKRRPQATQPARECDSLTESDALRSSARKSADEGQAVAVAVEAERLATEAIIDACMEVVERVNGGDCILPSRERIYEAIDVAKPARGAPDRNGTQEQRAAYWRMRCPQCGLSRTDDPGCQCAAALSAQPKEA